MRRRRAFTLIELMIVVTIIGILMAFILRAAMRGMSAAEQKASLSLIAKLESAITDRMDALANQHPEPTGVHYALAQIYSQQFFNAVTHPYTNLDTPAAHRAQVIAQYDMLRAELPDVFVVQAPGTGAGDGVYPLNFGGVAFGSTTPAYTQFLLPLGANGEYAQQAANSTKATIGIGITVQNSVPTSLGGYLAPTGIYGASFAAAAAIYRQLGYGPQGCDGADNDNDGDIDDLQEGLMGLPAGSQADIVARLANHKHKTARAEMLYAILVEGTGPMGSVFQRDDFNEQEVRDTDGDGLMEFVDAWGEPIQFFRWPILHHSDTQRGFPDLAKITEDLNSNPARTPGPYSSVYEGRETDTFDPNQQLMAPAWWTSFNDGPGIVASDANLKLSGAALTFMAHFHALLEPLALSPNAVPSSSTYWDRSTAASVASSGRPYMAGIFRRRAFYCRPLVLSGGADKIPGVAQLGVDYRTLDERSYFPLPGGGTPANACDSSGGAVVVNVVNVLQIENQGGKVDPNRGPAPYFAPLFSSPNRNDTNTFLEQAGNDDITGHNLNSLGGPTNQ